MSKRPRRRPSYASVAATIALVLSMTSGAFAAKHYLLVVGFHRCVRAVPPAARVGLRHGV